MQTLISILILLTFVYNCFAYQTYYVSSRIGSNINGLGTKAKPFEGLKYALQYVQYHSTVSENVIQLMDGVYFGRNNTNLIYDHSKLIEIKGSDNTIIQCNRDYYFLKIPAVPICCS